MWRAGFAESSFTDWIDRSARQQCVDWPLGCPDLIDQLHRCLSRPVDTVICSVLDLDIALPVQSMIAATVGR